MQSIAFTQLVIIATPRDAERQCRIAKPFKLTKLTRNISLFSVSKCFHWEFHEILLKTFLCHSQETAHDYDVEQA